MTVLPGSQQHRSLHTPVLTLVVGIVLIGLATACDVFVADDSERAAPPRDLTSTEKQVVEADNRFGLKLFRTAFQADNSSTGAPTNVFLSPTSVSMALGMTLNGARGETRTAMEQVLEKEGLSPSEINDAYRGLIDLLEGLDPKVDVALANSIWYRHSLQVRQAFIDTNEAHFDAEVEALDFSAPDASTRINDWVRDRTKGNISQIVKPQIPDSLMMYLINATYFKGSWRTQFDPKETTQEPFHLPDGSTTSVPMMKQTDQVEHPYLRTDAFTAVDLAYGDSLYTMTVLLPREDRSVRDIVDSLDAQQWSRVTSQMRSHELRRLEMPRFTLTYEKRLDDILSTLGMGIAFTRHANFRGIADTALAITKVKHKTFLQVDEKGTEASAATSVGIGLTSAPPSVVIDRPFVLAIRENHSGTILFIGAVMNPSAS